MVACNGLKTLAKSLADKPAGWSFGEAAEEAAPCGSHCCSDDAAELLRSTPTAQPRSRSRAASNSKGCKTS